MCVIFTGENSYLYKSFSTEFKRNLLTNNDRQLVLIGFKSPSAFIKNDRNLYDYNIERIDRTLDSCNHLKFSKITFLSAISVYGDNWDGVCNLPNPIESDFYSLAKLHCEQKIINFADSINAKYYILRAPGIVGPQSERNFISNLRDSIACSREIVVSELTHHFNNLITTTGIEIIISKIINGNINSGIYNLASKSPISIHTIIQMMEDFYLKKCLYRINTSKTERIIATNVIENVFSFNETVEDAIRFSLGE